MTLLGSLQQANLKSPSRREIVPEPFVSHLSHAAISSTVAQILLLFIFLPQFHLAFAGGDTLDFSEAAW